jgi:hypothetical protein
MKVIKVIQGVSGGWTITDAHLSPDNERCVYHALCIPVVYQSVQDNLLLYRERFSVALPERD